MIPATMQGRAHALEQLRLRRQASKERKPIDNSSLPAGSPMYFYCIGCGGLADTLPENYMTRPKRLCDECHALKELGWLE